MFNLDEALRNHLAQRQKEPKVRFVAGTVATLSPRSKAGRARVVAGVPVSPPSIELSPRRPPLSNGWKSRARIFTSPTTRCVFALLIGLSSRL